MTYIMILVLTEYALQNNSKEIIGMHAYLHTFYEIPIWSSPTTSKSLGVHIKRIEYNGTQYALSKFRH